MLDEILNLSKQKVAKCDRLISHDTVLSKNNQFFLITAKFITYHDSKIRKMQIKVTMLSSHLVATKQYEPHSEKTGFRGFRPSPTQTGLDSHRRWLDA